VRVAQESSVEGVEDADAEFLPMDIAFFRRDEGRPFSLVFGVRFFL